MQTTSLSTAHCWHFSPRWSARWAPHHPEPRPHCPEPWPHCPGPRPHRQQTGGNCTIRGATRRRHAEGRLLMVQNPPLRLGGGGLRARGGAAARPAVCARRPSCPDMTRGNCTNRGATRRRHADRMLLMLQNPHHHPWRHAPSLVHSSLTSTMPPNELNAPDQVSSFRWGASCLRRGDARTLAR